MKIAIVASLLIPTLAVAKPVMTAVIDREEPQFATRADAAKASARGTSGQLISVRIVAEHGDVVEVSTTYTPDDCIAASSSGYALTVFVPRAALVPRVAKAIVKTFADATGYAIYAGAPARVHGTTAELVDPFLRATGVVVPASQLATSIAQQVSQRLPATGERLVCDPDLEPLAAWQKKLAAKADAERKACEERLAAQAAKSPAMKPPATKPAKTPGTKSAPLTNGLDVEHFADLLTSEGSSCSAASSASMFLDRVEPPCLFNAAAKLELDGKATIPVSEGDRGEVSRSGTHTLVTFHTGCGEIRASADPKLLHGSTDNGGGLAGIGGSSMWWPRQNTKVYWPDGKLAGSYNGSESYSDAEIENRKDMICVSVRGVQSKVCHRRKDVDHR